MMTLRDVAWLFLPDSAIPLLVVVLGVVTVLGFVRVRKAAGILLMLALLPFISRLVEDVLSQLPPYVGWLIMLFFAANVARVVLEVFFGREAAGHILGHAVIGVFRGVGWILFGVVRLIFGALGGAFALLRHQPDLPVNPRSTALMVGLLALLACNGLSNPLEAQAGRAILRGAARRAAARQAERSLTRAVLARDLKRDAATASRRLTTPRRVFRFTSTERARAESRSGLAAGAHMTSRARPGRPPSGLTAQRRYGLPSRPRVRETIELTRGTPVRANRALAGRPGVGELTISRRIRPSSIQRTVRLSPGKTRGSGP